MTSEKHIFYFTYGCDKAESGHPFEGGWTVIEAPNWGAACQMFKAIHPDRNPDRLNCCSVYSEEIWGSTIMAQQGHNFGHACRERITWEVYDNE